MRTITFIAIFFVFATTSSAFAKGTGLIERKLIKMNLSTVPDSIGVEAVGGKQVIIHRLEPKETYYGLSQRYKIAVNELINANGNKPLKIGETIRIPTNRPAATPPRATTPKTTAPAGNQSVQTSPSGEPEPPRVRLNSGEYTEYKVSKGETLFAVSKRFRVPVESIRLANGLAGDNIQEGQILQVPKKAIQQAAPVVQAQPVEEPPVRIEEILDTTQAGEEEHVDLDLRKNKFGIREMTEKGLGVWIEDLSQEGASMLALHKTVPVGTVVKVTNPMTNHSTFVKVVGKFVDTAETQGAIIILSKSVANVIGILDRRFQIEIAYGAPVEEPR